MSVESLAGLRVLVVEDHDDSRDFLQQVLLHAGASVITASSAREAIPQLEHVDVVVTDFAMPGENGLWLLERVQERPHPMPVIVVTGYADVHAAELSRAAFARVLRKPTDPWQLCAEVRAVARAA